MTTLPPSSPAPPAARPPRFAGIDALRGLAVAQMIAYHFIYDLNYYRWLQLFMTREQPWVGWRTAIVSQFLFLVGVSLVLRHAFKPAWPDFWRRWAQIGGAALLVSAGSAAMFHDRFIFFGILHYIAVGLIVARLMLPLGRANLLLGIAVIVAGLTLKDPAFNPRALAWIGFSAQRPPTEDFVPLFPWLGATLIGVGFGTVWQRRGFAVAPALAALNAAPPRLLVLLGTWALTIYLVHQPILLGLLWVVRRLTG